MPYDPSSYKSTLLQVMAWCLTAPSHYLNQCWLSSMILYGVTGANELNPKRWPIISPILLSPEDNGSTDYIQTHILQNGNVQNKLHLRHTLDGIFLASVSVRVKRFETMDARYQWQNSPTIPRHQQTERIWLPFQTPNYTWMYVYVYHYIVKPCT